MHKLIMGQYILPRTAHPSSFMWASVSAMRTVPVILFSMNVLAMNSMPMGLRYFSTTSCSVHSGECVCVCCVCVCVVCVSVCECVCCVSVCVVWVCVLCVCVVWVCVLCVCACVCVCVHACGCYQINILYIHTLLWHKCSGDYLSTWLHDLYTLYMYPTSSN